MLGVVWGCTSTGAGAWWEIEDAGGALGQVEAPVARVAELKRGQLAAARSGRLGVVQRSGKSVLPVQWEEGEGDSEPRGVWLMPAGVAGRREFEWRESKSAFPAVMRAARDVASGQVDLSENGKPVLRYNYKTVEPGAVREKVTAGNRIYARARSDYIHPLFDLEGEALTRDWAVDHPHHRGIYWAWPEVDYGKERGDLHALQRVFARPTGKVRLQSGPVFAEVGAENVWRWEDGEAIVREEAVIRAYRATGAGRVIDLAFRFVALKEGITLARRGTEHYGGLSLRMATPAAQEIAMHTDASNAVPRRAWSDLSGVFGGARGASGLTVLQHGQNPDYPGDYYQVPGLSWCQPTFPAAGTRYALRPDKPLVLRYRLVVHAGARPPEERGAALWDALHAGAAAFRVFGR